MATVDPTINDVMTRIQLRQIKQKLDEEKRLRESYSSLGGGGGGVNEPDLKLQQAVRKRQELLDKLRHEQNLRDDLIRPSSYHMSRSPQQHAATPRRTESQPLLQQPSKLDIAYYIPDDTTGPRQVVEHQFKPVRLEPLDQTPKPPVVLQTAVPAPYLVNPTQPPAPPPQANTKTEMMEMMMLQNAQMHQMIMNQLMIQAMPKPSQDGSTKRVVEADDVFIRRRSSPIHVIEQTPRVPHQAVYTLPPVVGPPVTYPMYPSPRYYPTEVEPLKYPRARKKQKPKPKPAPGPLRRFRHAAYAVFFQKVLEKILRKKRGRILPVRETDQDFLFSIKLKEVVSALHAIYLDPTKKIGRILRDFGEDGARDLVDSVNSDRNSIRTKAIGDIDYIIENVIYEMTDIMPLDGVLGTHRKAHVVDMCRESMLYPRGYLWQIEKDLLHLDAADRTRNVGNFESHILLLGIFLGRAIVTTLLLKPVQYDLLKEPPGPSGKKNLKLLATIFVYLYRKMIVPMGQVETSLPFEVAENLYADDEMKSVYSSCKGSLAYGEKLIRKWSKEYVNRIRHVIDTEG
ncbi:hypothetical protein LSH36_723g01017 [Paralvinella palmiformis]|uniref:DUF4587 domain-containing protein n=1 Tax=Paralvinella palmiformis TaxID=53620 RepID=A0AAD9J219_9ANNE|nr:hypothetical protein LSH36_723g01017 [Paralvinella palmiformis]